MNSLQISYRAKAASFLFTLFLIMTAALFLSSCDRDDEDANYCHANEAYDLSVIMNDAGSGRVSSLPEGIFCEIDCAEDYDKFTEVTLTAAPYSGSIFSGWSGGGCTGTGPCTLTMDADTSVIASFDLSENDTLSLTTPYVNESDMREIRDIFNAQYSNLPWGRIHDGLDMYPNGDLKPFQAACSGRVHRIYTFNEQVTMLIACNSAYTLEYNFKAQAADTGQTQFDYIVVAEEQNVSQGEIIGYLYAAANVERAHVHFTLYKNAIPSCSEPYFIQAANDSILNVISVAHENVSMCLSGDVTPPPLAAPYLNASDMQKISASFSSDESFSPWGYVHGGIDIHPQGNLKAFQASCSGIVDSVQLQQAGVDSNWQVEVVIVCDNYVADPDTGGVFYTTLSRVHI